MSHTPFREMMTAAFDAPLSPSERSMLDAHLETCAACRALWEALAEVDTLFAAAAPVAAPSGFAARVSARLAARASRPRVVGGGLLLGLSAVTLVGLIFVPLAGALVALLSQPGTLVALARALAAIVSVCLDVGGGLWLALTALLDWSAQQPFVYATLLATLPLVWLWVYFFNRLSAKAVTT